MVINPSLSRTAPPGGHSLYRRLFIQVVTSRGQFPRIAAGVGGCRAGRVWPRLPERTPIIWRHPARLRLGRALPFFLSGI